ncbi:GTP-binding protein [Dokdonella sp.]|uniref:GTP-binding protein n=1 Tax=Dokdonella sp. TaxID=2291710 RepID=UPI002F426C8A
MSDVDAEEFKIVFTGPMGAGKTTAIAAISEVEPVNTEVENSDRVANAKESTTVGFDFGRITLADGSIVRLYGTPGQPRYRFMWDILGRGAAGVIILLDASEPGALVQLDVFVDAFLPHVVHGALVVGVGRTDLPDSQGTDAFAARLDARGIVAPVLSVDVRRRADVTMLVRTLVCILASHATHGAVA